MDLIRFRFLKSLLGFLRNFSNLAFITYNDTTEVARGVGKKNKRFSLSDL